VIIGAYPVGVAPAIPPPSTANTPPVIYAAALEVKKSARELMSCGIPIRPTGINAPEKEIALSLGSGCKELTSMKPGTIQFTWILSRAQVNARERVSSMTPAWHSNT